MGLFLGRRDSEIAFMRFKHLNLGVEEPTIELFNIKRGRLVSSAPCYLPEPLVKELRAWVA